MTGRKAESYMAMAAPSAPYNETKNEYWEEKRKQNFFALYDDKI